MHEIPNELKQEIIKNNVIVFVGAGLSYNFYNTMGNQLEGWMNLVDKMLFFLKENGYDVDYLMPLLEKCSPIQVLALIESNSTLPKRKIYDFIKAHFDLDHSKNDYGLHKKICDVFNKIITTNYDTAFEKAKPSLGRCKAYKGRNYELTKHNDPDAELLFKLHGCYEDCDSMVLFPTNYQDLYHNPEKDAEHSLYVLRNIIYNHTLLIIGSGMEDFQINHIFGAIRDIQNDCCQTHYILTRRSLDSKLGFLTPIQIENHSEIENIIDELLKIKTENLTEKQQETTRMKEQLEKAREEISDWQNKYENSRDENMKKDFLLNREANKYFSRGIEFHLAEEYQKASDEYQTCMELNPDQHEALYNWGIALSEQAMRKTGNEAVGLFELACEKYAKALEIKPDQHEALNNWGTALSDQAMRKTGDDAVSLFALACEKYAKALEINPDDHETLNNWGTALSDQAMRKTGDDAVSLFALACEKYAKALEIKPDDHEALNNWGNALYAQAMRKTGDDAVGLFALACEKYAKALEIKPDMHEVLNNWGLALSEQAKRKTGDDAVSLFALACEKYAKALEIKPDQHEALYNWGNTLSEQVMRKTGDEAVSLFALACEKYTKALEIKPDYHEALYNWGTVLSAQAKCKTGKEAEDLFAQAIDMFEKGIDMGGNCYNYACVHAILGHEAIACQSLDKALKNKEITVEFVEKDDDWVSLKDEKQFIEILERYR